MDVFDLMTLGAYVFPIEPGGKKPLMSGWQSHSTDNPFQVRQWLEQNPEINFGVDCGKSGWLVVDIDNKGDKQGDDTVFALDLQGKALPPTLTVRTPAGGYHRIYRGRGRNTAGRLGPGIDTRGVGGYIVAVGGRVGGGDYTVVEHLPLAHAPAWVIEDCGRSPDKADDPLTPVVALDSERAIAAARRYLETAEPAIQGVGGDAHTYRVAARAKDFGISRGVCLDLMLDSGWNERCEPPWSLDALDIKVKNVYRYGLQPPGVADAAHIFGEALPSGEPAGPDGFRSKSMRAYAGPPPARSWLIENWIPDDELTLITGAGGAGKSILTVQLCLAAVTGESFFGHKVTPRKRVFLYVGCEDDDSEFHRRWANFRAHPATASAVAAVEAEPDEDKQVFRYWSRVGMPSDISVVKDFHLVAGRFAVELDAEMKHLARVHGADTDFGIIIDTVADAYHGNENERSMVNCFVKEHLGYFKRTYRATIIVIGHPPKSNSTYSGSTAWHGAFRSRLFLADIDGAPKEYRLLEHAKGNYSAAQEPITLRYQDGCYVACTSDEDIFRDFSLQAQGHVYNTIREHAHADNPLTLSPQTKRALYLKKVRICGADKKPLPWDVVRAAANALLASGRVEEVEDPDHGPRCLYPCGGAEEETD